MAKKKGKKGKGNDGLEGHINKGLTKHQAINAVAGAGAVKIPCANSGKSEKY